MRIIAPLLKMGLSGGAIYVVANQGVFSISQKETIEASKQISNSLSGLDSYLDKVEIPIGFSKQDFVDYWNTDPFCLSNLLRLKRVSIFSIQIKSLLPLSSSTFTPSS
ncbi:hypothetical protein TNCT_193981, partial [Trichonephila clavata]